MENKLNDVIYLSRLVINSFSTNNEDDIEIQAEQIAKIIGHLFQSYCRLAARVKRLRSEVPFET